MHEPNDPALHRPHRLEAPLLGAPPLRRSLRASNSTSCVDGEQLVATLLDVLQAAPLSVRRPVEPTNLHRRIDLAFGGRYAELLDDNLRAAPPPFARACTIAKVLALQTWDALGVAVDRRDLTR